MKLKLLVIALFFFMGLGNVEAQRVSVRLNFPSGYHTKAYGRPSYNGAMWVGPEWRWRSGRYVSVPGYWSRPQRHHSVWVSGYWASGRRGYKWVPGHWR